jgi:hypothetical protein
MNGLVEEADTTVPGRLPTGNDGGSCEDGDDYMNAGSSTSGSQQEIKWEVVSKTAGITPAEIIVGRLKSEGIPAMAWQEGAGQTFGLTIGLLGTGYVVVPEAYADQAKAILATAPDETFLEEEE